MIRAILTAITFLEQFCPKPKWMNRMTKILRIFKCPQWGALFHSPLSCLPTITLVLPINPSPNANQPPIQRHNLEI